jgi:broad specificity phosphatase PhoE
MHVVIARHAHADKPEGIFDGVGDPGLDRTGRVQSGRLTHALASIGVTHVVTSNTRRTAETAMPLVVTTGTELWIDGDIGEFRWAGLSGTPIKRHFAGAENDRAQREGWEYQAVEDAEVRVEAAQRMLGRITAVAQELPDDALPAFYTHGLSARCLLGYVGRLKFDEARRLPMANATAVMLNLSTRSFTPLPVNQV